MALAKTEKRKRRKHWYAVLAPKQFQKMKLGESQAYAAEELVGRTIQANLMTLTNDPKRQSITLTFRIESVNGNNCETNVVKYTINNSHIKRLVRKASNKIEESFVVTTKDNVRYRIKPIVLTRYRANKSVLTALRKKTVEIVTAFVAGMESEALFPSVISHKLQMETKNTLKKIYPVAICEVKSLILVPAKKP